MQPSEPVASPGTLVVLGTGISAINQLTIEAHDWIERADLVCYCVSEPLTAQWIQRHAQASLDLARCYSTEMQRRQSYAQMAELVVHQLHPKRSVVMALYGHPGVAAEPGHLAIAKALAAGHRAWMLASVSAADVLFADLGIDPCRGGCQWFEATDFLVQRRTPDVLSHVLLWQIGALNQTGFTEGSRYRSDLLPLKEGLFEYYPADHRLIHYQAAQQVVQAPLIQRLPLSELCSVEATGASTLVVPPFASANRVNGPAMPQAAVDHALPELAPGARLSEPLPSALARLIERLATNTDEWLAYQHDRGGVLAETKLDPVERWALLRRHAPLIRKALEMGSAQRAAVSLGIAPTEAEAVACCLRWLERSDSRRAGLAAP